MTQSEIKHAQMSKATGFGIGVCLCLEIRASDEGRAEDSGPRSVTHLGKKAQKIHYENCTHAINSNFIQCYIHFPTSHQLNIFGWLIKNKIQVAINANSFTEFRLITVKTEYTQDLYLVGIAQLAERLPAMQEDWVQFPVWQQLFFPFMLSFGKFAPK